MPLVWCMPVLPLAATSTGAENSFGSHHAPEVKGLNSWDLPQLLPQQSNFICRTKWHKWGRKGRATRADAWHFYAADYKFESLLRQPTLLLRTGAQQAVECNVSTFGDDPLPVALAGLFRKRCVTQVWQQAGVDVAIDLNVCGHARDLVTVGVPTSHTLWASKWMLRDITGVECRWQVLEDDYALARRHVDPELPVQFLVYGGGQKVRAGCDERGWHWIPNAVRQLEA